MDIMDTRYTRDTGDIRVPGISRIPVIPGIYQGY